MEEQRADPPTADPNTRPDRCEPLEPPQTLLRLVGRMAKLGVWSVTVPAAVMTWSDETAAICEAPPGFSPALEAGFGFIAAEYRKTVRAALEDCMQRGTPFDVETVILTATGRRVCGRVVGEAVRDDSGAITHVQGVLQDISAQRAAARGRRTSARRSCQSEPATNLELRASVEKYQSLFDSIDEGLCIIEVLFDSDDRPTDYRFLEVNRAFEQQTGIQNAPGRTMREIAPAHEEHWFETYGRIALTGVPVRFESPAAQLQRWYDAYAFRIGEPQQRRVAIMFNDITARRHAEQALRTSEAQLRQAQKMEAIGRLAGGVAHDFNNILAAISGNLALALHDVPVGHAARQCLEEIGKASNRATSLVRRIVTFSRQESDDRRTVRLGPLVEESVGLLRATLPASVTLAVCCAPDAPNVLADVTQMQQTILNLGTNAWHALEGGAGTITVSLAAVEVASESARSGLDPGRYARLSVSDTGVGIDAATLERIFEPFFTTKEPGHGTGLGLSVVHGIVKAHAGRIAVSSAPGQGSRFDIYLPAAEAGTDAPLAAATGFDALRGQGERLLYLDDEDALVELATRQFERLGFRVSGFTDSAAAIDAFRANPAYFDVVVTDFNMPGRSGLQVASELLAVRPDLPVVMSSGYVTEDLRASADQLGVEVVYKSNTAEELCDVLLRTIDAVRASN